MAAIGVVDQEFEQRGRGLGSSELGNILVGGCRIDMRSAIFDLMLVLVGLMAPDSCRSSAYRWSAVAFKLGQNGDTTMVESGCGCSVALKR